jgi:hypothetical protein
MHALAEVPTATGKTDDAAEALEQALDCRTGREISRGG